MVDIDDHNKSSNNDKTYLDDKIICELIILIVTFAFPITFNKTKG